MFFVYVLLAAAGWIELFGLMTYFIFGATTVTAACLLKQKQPLWTRTVGMQAHPPHAFATPAQSGVVIGTAAGAAPMQHGVVIMGTPPGAAQQPVVGIEMQTITKSPDMAPTASL